MSGSIQDPFTWAFGKQNVWVNPALFPYLSHVLGVGSLSRVGPTGELLVPFQGQECELCCPASDFLVLFQPPGSQLAPLQPPLGPLSPLRGLTPSSSLPLRGSLNPDRGSVLESSLIPKEGTLVRLPLP